MCVLMLDLLKLFGLVQCMIMNVVVIRIRVVNARLKLRENNIG